MRNGLSVVDYAKHLFAFTASSPIVNLLVYHGLVFTQDGNTDLLALQFWVGILMLVSAGSFLYVATMHILPEAYSSPEGDHGENKLSTEKRRQYDTKHFSKPVELACLMTGIFFPMLLQFVPDE